MYHHKSKKLRPEKKLNVFIINNKPVECEGIKAFLTEKYDPDLITAPPQLHVLIEMLNNEVFDFIMLDSNLPGVSAYALILLIRGIKESKPAMPILVLGSEDQRIALWVLQAGATGYINKSCDEGELITSVDCMIRGRRYFNRDIAEQLPLIWNKKAEFVLPHKSLSHREYQVMLFLAQGFTVSEIGRKMDLSVKTISTYKSRLMEKMDMTTTVDLVKYTMSLGLSNLNPTTKLFQENVPETISSMA